MTSPNNNHRIPANKARKSVRKPQSFVFVKSSIMVFSIAGTLAGWVLFVSQETQLQPTNEVVPVAAQQVELQDSTPLDPQQLTTQTAVQAPQEPTLVDISQLRQVNADTVQPEMQNVAVTRTRSSR